ncbi:transcription termination factor MTERF4, chloroplastic-like [Coffea eugenioides]|uniref:Transcription termination factor MTERF4, chloroplastic-like isoform X1 n=2 Tax=Coffea arabica TaxID=13443 RepID=A0A6P6UGA0_COFAR|nr:transcription termination factor MTERF4, chloroplastic-like isoform X1 [Coffea arabica]XP_027092887.1 transcription termination factor MTERF4, chloroplastic-like isoform X1 [Coffea arabica]XP_027149014.1 transcription termination factor MTERF4, chloroplastic-like [Coffea eugenioides]
MFARISRLEGNPTRIFCFKSLLQYYSSTSTAVPAAALKPQNQFLAEYLINSLGFSKQEAISASNKVKRLNSIEKDFDLVVDFLKKTGLNQSQIKSLVSVTPQVLLSKVDKTLKPKLQILRDIGLSGSDLVKVVMNYRTFFLLGLDNHLKHHVNYLRTVLGSDEKVALALKKYGMLLDHRAPERLASTVSLLQKVGFSDENVVRFIMRNPKRSLVIKPGWIEDILHRVENELGIPRESRMFFYGIEALASVSKSTLEMKLDNLRSFGWPDEEIFQLIRKLPFILNLSVGKVGAALDFYMKELGCTPDYLASRPVFFSFDLERRVKPRVRVLETLNKKKLNTKNTGLDRVLGMPESKFVNNFLLPHKDILPNMYEQYLKSVGQQKAKELCVKGEAEFRPSKHC